MDKEMTWLERVETMKSVLNSLSDSTGTARCKYICVLDELLNQLRNDGLIMEEKLKDLEEAEKIQNGTET